MPGYHGGGALRKWGHMKLRAVLEGEAFADDFRRAPLVYQVTGGEVDLVTWSHYLVNSALLVGRRVDLVGFDDVLVEKQSTVGLVVICERQLLLSSPSSLGLQSLGECKCTLSVAHVLF